MSVEQFYVIARVCAIILWSIFTVCLVFIGTSKFTHHTENILIIIAIITGLIFVLVGVVIGCLGFLNSISN